MNTKSVNVSTKRVNANGPILAIDLGKYKSVACIYERTEPSWQLTSFTTNRAELIKLLDKHQPSVVVIEACALCGWVLDLCAERGVSCKVANTTSDRASSTVCEAPTLSGPTAPALLAAPLPRKKVRPPR